MSNKLSIDNGEKILYYKRNKIWNKYFPIIKIIFTSKI